MSDDGLTRAEVNSGPSLDILVDPIAASVPGAGWVGGFYSGTKLNSVRARTKQAYPIKHTHTGGGLISEHQTFPRAHSQLSSTVYDH